MVKLYDCLITGGMKEQAIGDIGDWVRYDDYAALQAENERLAEAMECMLFGACAVAVPNNGERAVLQDAVNIARAALAACRKGGAQ